MVRGKFPRGDDTAPEILLTLPALQFYFLINCETVSATGLNIRVFVTSGHPV